jgi:membrane protease YdiL (CAAX protease family)
MFITKAMQNLAFIFRKPRGALGSKQAVQNANIVILCAASVLLVALQYIVAGYILLAAGFALLWLSGRDFRRTIGLVYACIALLGISPINTSTDLQHVIRLGVPMLAVIVVPYIVTRYVYKLDIIKISLRLRRRWSKREVLYYFVTVLATYLILPIILASGNSYMNWNIENNTRSLVESFLGLNAVGTWDELFFVTTVFALFRFKLKLWTANIAQAVLFTSFLYNMGFQGWCFPFVFLFALTQGYWYYKTNSLAYVLAVHLTIDLVLHLALTNLHNPQLAPIFLTG